MGDRAESPIGSIPFPRAEHPDARAVDLAYLRFERRDPAAAAGFLRDFGLVPLGDGFFRGGSAKPFIYEVVAGDRDRFLGLALEMASEEDLRNVAAAEHAQVVDNPRPGGGLLATMTDPAGFEIHAVFAQQQAQPLRDREPLAANSGEDVRRVNTGHRLERKPPLVRRAGHVVLNSINFQEVSRWYRQRFGLLPTDVLCLEDGTPVLAFMRCNRLSEPADHHTIVVASGIENSFGHAAFEVVDHDAVGMGSEVLREGGYDHAWGIGRHLLGSQVFDYWRDPAGDRHEHFADSDVFDADAETGYHPLDAAGLYQWGPDLPKDFEDTRMTPKRLVGLVKTLRGDNELTVSKLKGLLSAMKAPARPWM